MNRFDRSVIGFGYPFSIVMVKEKPRQFVSVILSIFDDFPSMPSGSRIGFLCVPLQKVSMSQSSRHDRADGQHQQTNGEDERTGHEVTTTI
ncbi:MAG: hypothetical protein U0798_03155 [Gemmataceae bacterium]